VRLQHAHADVDDLVLLAVDRDEAESRLRRDRVQRLETALLLRARRCRL
jgi:hypothetical protein